MVRFKAYEAPLQLISGDNAMLKEAMHCGKKTKNIINIRLILINLKIKAIIVIAQIEIREIGKNHLKRKTTYVQASARASPDFTQKFIKKTKAIRM